MTSPNTPTEIHHAARPGACGNTYTLGPNAPEHRCNREPRHRERDHRCACGDGWPAAIPDERSNDYVTDLAMASIANSLRRIAVAVEQLVQAPTSTDPFAGKALAPDACPRCGHGSLWHDNGGTGPCSAMCTGRCRVTCDCPGPPTTTVETTDA